jgi:hypothetical protein
VTYNSSVLFDKSVAVVDLNHPFSPWLVNWEGTIEGFNEAEYSEYKSGQCEIWDLLLPHRVIRQR